MVWEGDSATRALRGDTCCWGNTMLSERLDSTSRREGGSPHQISGVASSPDGHLAGQGGLEPADPQLYMMEQHQLQTPPFSPPCRTEGCASPPRPPRTLGIPKLLSIGNKQRFISFGDYDPIFIWLGAFSR